MTTQELLLRARGAKDAMAMADTQTKDRALLAMADALEAEQEDILAANAQDLEQARGTVSDVMLDRLALSPERIRGMAQGIREVAALPDPVGEVLARVERPNGLVIEKTAVPMGVIAIIYESRPNVTSDAAALALKAGSACVLRGGKEAHRSAKAIVSALKQGMEQAGLLRDALQLVEDTSRDSANQLMQARGLVDLLIPRGGAGLIRACVDNATVPVLETGTGICHIYVDRDADQTMALDILENAKCSRPSVCNAAEVCLVHRDIAKEFLPKFQKRMVEDRAAAGLHPVQLRLDGTAAALNRCHSFAEFCAGFSLLREAGLYICIHLINGLPGETPEMMLESARAAGAPEGLSCICFTCCARPRSRRGMRGIRFRCSPGRNTSRLSAASLSGFRPIWWWNA